MDADFPPEIVSEKATRRQTRKASKERKQKESIKAPLTPKTKNQAIYLEALREANQVFGIGGAGTGKTYLAARHAIRQLADDKISNLYIARPTVAPDRHRLGFLPGNANAKLRPWLVPLVEAFKEEISREQLDILSKDRIEFLAFEHIRGRTLKNCIVILDEAQNCTLADLRTFLTRIGENAQVIVCGDTDQVDIHDSGLDKIIDMIEDYDIDADIIEFGEEDVVRSKIAKEWVSAFAKLKEA